MPQPVLDTLHTDFCSDCAAAQKEDISDSVNAEASAIFRICREGLSAESELSRALAGHDLIRLVDDDQELATEFDFDS